MTPDEVLARLKDWRADLGVAQVFSAERLDQAIAMIETLVRERDEAREAVINDKAINEMANTIEALELDRERLMARLERDHAFRLVDGKMVRVEMELDDSTDGIACRDATIAELEDQLSSAFTHGAEAMREDAAKCIDEMAAQIAFYTLADGAAVIRTLPISTPNSNRRVAAEEDN